jgi:uncharacterized protein YndB with AHSA1/START domain
MNKITEPGAFGAIIEPDTLTIQRVLPGPAERIWSYLTDSDMRSKWLAAGVMDLVVGAPFELVWRNDELTSPPGHRPEGFSEEHRMASTITAVDAPSRLVFTWGEKGEVEFELEPEGEDVLLTITHRRISDRENMLMIGAGWHMHLDVLAARVEGGNPEPFWDGWLRLREDYDRRIPR